MSYSYSLSELLLNHDPLDNIYYYTAHFWPNKDCNIIVGNFPTSNFSIVESDVILKSSSFWEIHFWRNYSNGSPSKFFILDFFPHFSRWTERNTFRRNIGSNNQRCVITFVNFQLSLGKGGRLPRGVSHRRAFDREFELVMGAIHSASPLMRGNLM